MADDIPTGVVAEIAFVGRTGGLVKALSGFRKAHHSIPDAANAATNAFLGKISAGELAAEAESLFQAVRAGFCYKRREIALEVASPVAVLGTKDFTVEISYALEAGAPSRFVVTTLLRGVHEAAVVRTEAMAGVFARRFSEISFALKRAASVEAVIDAIEAVGGARGLAVSYPSDYRECEIAVAGVDARVRCTPEALGIVFTRPSAPGDLLDAFVQVREAFQIDPVLATLTS